MAFTLQAKAHMVTALQTVLLESWGSVCVPIPKDFGNAIPGEHGRAREDRSGHRSGPQHLPAATEPVERVSRITLWSPAVPGKPQNNLRIGAKRRPRAEFMYPLITQKHDCPVTSIHVSQSSLSLLEKTSLGSPACATEPPQAELLLPRR